jgi:EAL domain
MPIRKAIKAAGVRVAVDDFGTGYSSLAYLSHFPVDSLKIDRTFISAIATSPEAGALIHTLVQLGKSLGLETVAEGIEEQAQFRHLQSQHCDSGQGYLFARPLAEHNRGARAGQHMGGCSADPACRSGQYRHPVREVEGGGDRGLRRHRAHSIVCSRHGHLPFANGSGPLEVGVTPRHVIAGEGIAD